MFQIILARPPRDAELAWSFELLEHHRQYYRSTENPPDDVPQQHNNHTEALVLLNTGKIFQGRPALGSWISYALGTENRNLPAYIVLRDPAGYNTSGTLLWENGWLPALYRGTEVNTQGTPILNMKSKTPQPIQRRNLDFLAKLNERHRQDFPVLAGAAFKSGFIYGKTDDVGYKSVENRVTVHDLHATILHQLGFDHHRLTYRHHGNEETLTDSRVTDARVVGDLLIKAPQVT